jgi:hypothetical protein
MMTFEIFLEIALQNSILLRNLLHLSTQPLCAVAVTIVIRHAALNTMLFPKDKLFTAAALK